MIFRVHSATILVSDQDAALNFYVNTLGWTKDVEYEMSPGMRFITVTPDPDSAQVALASPDWMPENWGTIGGQTGISVTSQVIDATYAEFTKRGVRFKGPVEDMPWGGRATWFYDQDDNEFFLVGE